MGQDKVDMLDFILYLSRLSGPHWQYSSEATSPTSPPSPSPEDDGVGKLRNGCKVSRSKKRQLLSSIASQALTRLGLHWRLVRFIDLFFWELKGGPGEACNSSK